MKVEHLSFDEEMNIHIAMAGPLLCRMPPEQAFLIVMKHIEEKKAEIRSGKNPYKDS